MPTPVADTAKPQVTTRVVRVGNPFFPRDTDSAIAAFRPAVLPADSAGNCSTTRTTGSGATRVTARFFARDSSTTLVTFVFDSAGNLVRFSDTRGSRSFRPPPGATPAQFDSIRRAAEAGRRITTISLDFAIDQALAVNRAGSSDTEAIIGTVRRFENLQSLGPPNERIRRIRKFCGV